MAIIRVRPSDGNDVDDGSTWALAKATIQGAVNAMAAGGGDSIWLASGEVHSISAAIDFTGITPTNIRPSSMEGRNTTDDSREIAEIDLGANAITCVTAAPPSFVYQNLRIRNNTGANILLSIGGAIDSVVIDCVLADGGSHGLALPTDGKVINSEIRDCAGIGILNGGSGRYDVIGCLLHGITGEAIRLGSRQCTALFNRVRNSDGHGINVNVSNSDALIIGNSIVGKDAAGDVGINYPAGNTALLQIGNIIQDWETGIHYNTTGGPQLKGFNIFHSNTTDEAGLPVSPDGPIVIAADQIVDPQFADLLNNDFTINNTALREAIWAIGLHHGAMQTKSVGGVGGGRRQRLRYA